MDEARLLWLSQPTAPRAFSREEIMANAKRFETRNHVKVGLFWILATLLIVLGLYHGNISLSFAKFIVACLVVLAFEKTYGFTHKLEFVTLGLNAASNPSITFYRDELLRRRRFFEKSYRRLLLPLLFLISESIRFVGQSLRDGAFINLIPVSIVLAGWLTFTVLRRRRELPLIERELEALRRLM
jgi:hypothetical protein